LLLLVAAPVAERLAAMVLDYSPAAAGAPAAGTFSLQPAERTPAPTHV
jgi:hypothetical protein